MIHAIQPSGSLPAEKQIKYKFSIIFLLFYLLLSYYTYSTNQYLCYLLLFSASQYFISFLMLWLENQINSTFVEFTWLSTILHSFTQTLLILFILLIAKQMYWLCIVYSIELFFLRNINLSLFHNLIGKILQLFHLCSFSLFSLLVI